VVHSVLALDPSTLTGYASRVKGFEGQIYFQSGVHKVQGEGALRFTSFRTWLRGMAHGVDHVYTEVPHMRGRAATFFLVGLYNSIQEICQSRKIQFHTIHTGTLKKLATGRGDASKSDMMDRARQLYPDVNVLDDNHADALCLLWIAEKELEGS
jgi:crossover junction endodeoxyribonuclease RuvC